MHNNKMITLIGLVLIVFVFFSILASQLCRPSQNNVVAVAVTNALVPAQPIQSTPDPLSWEPVLRQLMNFLSKACPP